VQSAERANHQPLITPSPFAQHNNRDLAACKICWYLSFLSVVTSASNPAASASFSKSPFFQFLPSAGAGLCDQMAIDQKTSKGARRPVVEKN
jgi:hypothetical protein